MDYMYPGVFLAYFLFALLTLLAVFFFVKSLRHGYLGRNSEEPKYRMMLDDREEESHE